MIWTSVAEYILNVKTGGVFDISYIGRICMKTVAVHPFIAVAEYPPKTKMYIIIIIIDITSSGDKYAKCNP